MLLDSLLSRRLVVLTGKGGVGKSVVGAALALAARGRGKRVLLVEVAAPLEASRRLGGPASRGRETEALPGLFTLNLDPQAVMDEYVRHMVKLDLVARRVLASPIYHRFFAAAPGLKELMVLGKIMVLEEARKRLSREPLWDLIVVDAPATGHGLAYLKVPLAASLAVPVGPIGHNARRILTMLRDPERTALVVVAAPEEMAAVEAVELYRAAQGEVGDRAAGRGAERLPRAALQRRGRGRGAAPRHARARAASSSPACRSRPRCAPRAGRSAAASSRASTATG